MIDELLTNDLSKGAKQVQERASVLPPEDLVQILSSIQTILQFYLTNQDEEEEEGGGDLDLSKEEEESIKNLADYLKLPLASLGDGNSTRIRDALPDHIRLGIRLRPWRGTGNAKAIVHQILTLETFFRIRKVQKNSQIEHWPKWKLQKSVWLVDEKYNELIKAGDRASKEYLERIQQDRDSDQDEGEIAAGYILNIAEAITEAALEQE